VLVRRIRGIAKHQKPGCDPDDYGLDFPPMTDLIRNPLFIWFIAMCTLGIIVGYFAQWLQ
jgi:hypothetical protein